MCVRMYLYALGPLRGGPFEGGKKSHYRRVYVFRRKRKHWIFIASRECLYRYQRPKDDQIRLMYLPR